MMCTVIAFLTKEAVLKVERKLSLPSTWKAALWAGYGESTGLWVVVELGLAGEDALAADALKVISLKVLVQCILAGTIKFAARLQTVFVL
jgi:hypothetical protein